MPPPPSHGGRATEQSEKLLTGAGTLFPGEAQNAVVEGIGDVDFAVGAEGDAGRRAERAVLGAGTILTRGTPVHDLVRGQVYRATAETPLEIPENAVVVPGARGVTKGKAAEWNLSLYTPVIVKYRDEKTARGIELEDLLR